ncbi:hypothetical protein E2P81_ATG03658 [Venturia nashicola]|nr:hypothetical protein E2P81_ATG03658 [Venturia nashicola]
MSTSNATVVLSTIAQNNHTLPAHETTSEGTTVLVVVLGLFAVIILTAIPLLLSSCVSWFLHRKQKRARERNAANVEAGLRTAPDHIPGPSPPPAAPVVNPRQSQLQRWIDEEMCDERRTLEASRGRYSTNTLSSRDLRRSFTQHAVFPRPTLIYHAPSIALPAYQ